MAKVDLHANRWRENNEFYNDAETGLPTALGPFQIRKVPKTGQWEIHDHNEAVTQLPKGGIFAAYRAMVDAYEAWFRTLEEKKVYFIGESAKLTGMVKIGVARDPASRLPSLQTGYPHKLHILGAVPGDEKREREYHKRFAKQRRHGEWFVINRALLNEIEGLDGWET